MKYVLIFLLLTVACNNQHALVNNSEVRIANTCFDGKVVLSKLKYSEGFKIQLINNTNEILDQIIFKYASYQLDTADVNQDGRTEILLGLIKKTHFDPSEKKRLFILRIDEGQLRPLWLGSRVCQELVDFKTKAGGIIQTFEKTKRGTYAIGEYKWQGFGLTLVNYIQSEISFDNASKIFNN